MLDGVLCSLRKLGGTTVGGIVAILIGFLMVSLVWAGVTWASPPELDQAGGPQVLPEECVGVNPPGLPIPDCCVYGYVYYEGKPVSGAEVQIESASGVITATTGAGGESDLPYYSVDLDPEPLLVAAGDWITVGVTVGEIASSVTYQVVPDGQQLDLAVNRPEQDWWDEGYAFRRGVPIETFYPLAAGTTIKVGGIDLDALVSAGQVRPDLWDLRLVRRDNTGLWQEVPCVSYGTQEVSFDLIEDVQPGVDVSYSLYYGNPDVLAPPDRSQCDSLKLVAEQVSTGRLGGTGNGFLRMSGPLLRTTWQPEEPLARFAPIATIHAVYPHPARQAVDTVSLRGSAIDDDELGATITAYEWYSDLDGILATQPSADIPASAFTAGDHTISLRVRDDEGTWSWVLQRKLRVLPPASAERPWLYVLYLAGDNNLGRSLERALYDLEQMASNENVNVVALLDGPGTGDTWRYLVQPGGAYVDGVTRWRMGELDMDDPQTLADLVSWARENYPARYTYLAVADHGRGTTGMAWDDTSGSSAYLDVEELGTALGQASLAGGPLDVVHYDACLMAMVENAYQIKDSARYWVASENLAWGTFAYDRYVGLVDETTTPQQLAEAVVREYSALLSRYPHTISAMDLGQAGSAADAVSALAEALQVSLPEAIDGVRQARSLAQKFDSTDYYQITDEDAYLDLYDLARVLKQSVPDAGVQDAAQRAMDAVDRFVVAERRVSGAYQGHSYWDLDGAHGVAIWFPMSPGGWDAAVYRSGAYRFTSEGSWDEFLDAYLGIGGQPVTAFEAPGVPPVMMPDGGDGS